MQRKLKGIEIRVFNRKLRKETSVSKMSPQCPLKQKCTLETDVKEYVCRWMSKHILVLNLKEAHSTTEIELHHDLEFECSCPNSVSFMDENS